MTTLITKTPVPLCVVGVKKDWIEDGYELRGSYDPKKNNVLSFMGCHPAMELPPGKWQIAFLWSERTEEKCDDLVHKSAHGNYKDYRATSHTKYGSYLNDTALESIESLFKSKELFTENPHNDTFGEKPELSKMRIVKDENGKGEFDKRSYAYHNESDYKRDLDLWQSAQSKVSEEWIILKQVI